MLVVIDTLLKRPRIKRNLYWEFKTVSAERQDIRGVARKKKVVKKIYGITTSGGKEGTRNIMVNDILYDIVKNGKELVTSNYVFKDIAGLERNKKGKIEHSPYSKDDNLMAFLVAQYVIRYGTNFKSYVIDVKETFEKNQQYKKRLFDANQCYKTVDEVSTIIDIQKIITEDEDKILDKKLENNKKINKKLLDLLLCKKGLDDDED
jgi:hypothetical protein